MKIPLTIKQVIWLLIAIVVTSFIFSGLFQSLMVYSETGADWISALIQALGNIVGGLIGGIVAIIVAAYQVNKALHSEENKQLLTSNTMLKLIREELRDNISTIVSLMPYNHNDLTYHNLILTQLSDDMWKSTMIYLVIPDNLLVKVNVAYRKVGLLKSLQPDEVNDQILHDTKDILTNTLNLVGEQIKETGGKIETS